jgi:central glycolytic genes regulator
MENLIKIQQKLIPQVLEIMEKRYCILRQISLSEPIGRRSLSNILGMSERIIRSETEFLKNQGLINVDVSGMVITNEGLILLDSLKDTMNNINGISKLQEKTKEKLKVKKVIVVPGNYDENETLLKDIAKSACEYFLDILSDKDIVAITGGTTMLKFAQNLKIDKKYPNVRIVPARGSVGKEIETQSNNIVASIGKKLNSHYSLLHIPDILGKEAMETLYEEPEIKNTLDYIKNTNILVFGIGKADEMAYRRKLSQEKIDEIISKEAVGEAFGYYFNKDGDIVHEINTVGIDLETFKSIKETIAIFAGINKAEAAIAISKLKSDMVLITDESTCYKILDMLEK